MSATLCIQLCKASSDDGLKDFYEYSLITTENCYCANDLSGSSESTSSYCQYPCKGNPKQLCGDSNQKYYSVYGTGKSVTNTCTV